MTSVTANFTAVCLTDDMLPGRVTHTILRLLDRVTPNTASVQPPAHILTGRRGEEDAYFYLRRRGYVMVARNYRTARHRGEIDLIGWDKEVLCFIEVKTRTTRDVKPAEAAVDRKKRHELRVVIRDYLRTLPRREFPQPPPWRFDVITVYYASPEESTQAPSKIEVQSGSRSATKNASKMARARHSLHVTFELFQNAALSS